MYSLEKNSYREITLRYTVWCRYNAVSFLTNIHERHPIAHPSGRGMGCLLWIQHQIDISLQLLMWYLIILDRVLTALDCIVTHIEIKYAPMLTSLESIIHMRLCKKDCREWKVLWLYNIDNWIGVSAKGAPPARDVSYTTSSFIGWKWIG